MEEGEGEEREWVEVGGRRRGIERRGEGEGEGEGKGEGEEEKNKTTGVKFVPATAGQVSALQDRGFKIIQYFCCICLAAVFFNSH